MAKIEIRVRMRWWCRVYVEGVVFVARLFGLEPDWEKLRRVLERGISYEVIKPCR